MTTARDPAFFISSVVSPDSLLVVVTVNGISLISYEAGDILLGPVIFALGDTSAGSAGSDKMSSDG